MSETLTTYIVDFSQTGGNTETPQTEDVPVFQVSFCPATITQSTPFRIIAQGDSRFEINWPYPNSLSFLDSSAESYSQHLDLSGSEEINPNHPVESVTSITTISPTILDSGTGLIYLLAGGVSLGSIPFFINGTEAKLGKVKLPGKCWGTVRINYKSRIRRWQCAGLPDPGEHVVGFNFKAPITLNGVITDYHDNYTFSTFQVSGDLGADTGTEDFCVGIGG